MAAVLEFRCDRRRGPQAAARTADASPAPEGGCEIIIFPGVRVERHYCDGAYRREVPHRDGGPGRQPGEGP